jgi:hypothetical protein
MNDLPRRGPAPDNGPHASLRAIANGLSANGLNVRNIRHDGDLVEIAVTDPRHPFNGKVVLGCEGWLTWEFDCLIETLAGIEKTRNLVASLLTHAVPTTESAGTGQ